MHLVWWHTCCCFFSWDHPDVFAKRSLATGSVLLGHLFLQSPYLRPWLNNIWSGLWFGLVYTTALLLALNYHEVAPEHEYAFRESMTWGVLYGIFPAVLLGMAVSHYAYKWAVKPLEQYEQARQAAARGELQVESAAVMKRIYRCEIFGRWHDK